MKQVVKYSTYIVIAISSRANKAYFTFAIAIAMAMAMLFFSNPSVRPSIRHHPSTPETKNER